MTIEVSDAGYIFVTRKQWGGVLAAGVWVTFCNLQMMEFCGVCGGCVGYIFVTRDEECVAVVVGSGIYGLHKWEK